MPISWVLIERIRSAVAEKKIAGERNAETRNVVGGCHDVSMRVIHSTLRGAAHQLYFWEGVIKIRFLTLT